MERPEHLDVADELHGSVAGEFAHYAKELEARIEKAIGEHTHPVGWCQKCSSPIRRRVPWPCADVRILRGEVDLDGLAKWIDESSLGEQD